MDPAQQQQLSNSFRQFWQEHQHERNEYSWLEPDPNDPFRAHCKLCDVTLGLAIHAWAAADIHSKGRRHQTITDGDFEVPQKTPEQFALSARTLTKSAARLAAYAATLATNSAAHSRSVVALTTSGNVPNSPMIDPQPSTSNDSSADATLARSLSSLAISAARRIQAPPSDKKAIAALAKYLAVRARDAAEQAQSAADRATYAAYRAKGGDKNAYPLKRKMMAHGEPLVVKRVKRESEEEPM